MLGQQGRSLRVLAVDEESGYRNVSSPSGLSGDSENGGLGDHRPGQAMSQNGGKDN